MGAGLLADVAEGAVNRVFTVSREIGREEPGTALDGRDVLGESDTRRRSRAPAVFAGSIR